MFTTLKNTATSSGRPALAACAVLLTMTLASGCNGGFADLLTMAIGQIQERITQLQDKFSSYSEVIDELNTVQTLADAALTPEDWDAIAAYVNSSSLPANLDAQQLQDILSGIDQEQLQNITGHITSLLDSFGITLDDILSAIQQLEALLTNSVNMNYQEIIAAIQTIAGDL